MAEAAAVATVVSVLGSTYYQDKKHKEEKKATQRANQLAAEQAAIEREAQQAALRETERRNRNLLAQQQSSYKAKLGASGLTSQSGSGQVVLDSMKKEKDMENKYEQTKTKYTLNSLTNNLKQTNNRNLLKLNTISLDRQENLLNGATTLGKMAGGSEKE